MSHARTSNGHQTDTNNNNNNKKNDNNIISKDIICASFEDLKNEFINKEEFINKCVTEELPIKRPTKW